MRRRPSPALRAGGYCLLAVCSSAAGLLVLQHFDALQLPGCSAASQCAAAAASIWGSMGGWPVSFLGLAYFASMTAGWVAMGHHGVPIAYRLLAWLGGLASIAYLLIMAIGGYSCPYCLAIHVANLTFCVLVGFSQRARERSWLAFGTTCAGFVLVSSLLNVAVSEQQRMARERAERLLYESIQQVVPDRSSQQVVPDRGSDADRSSSPIAAATEQVASADVVGSKNSPGLEKPEDSLPTSPEKSKSREPYRRGAVTAPIKLLIFGDYQCEFCQRIDSDVQILRAKYRDMIAVTVRHYPLCVDCNYLVPVNLHPNACRAARAAEAAGILKGADGFWRVHNWLFENQGTFTDDELRQAILDWGFTDTEAFFTSMQSQEVLSVILADIVEARALGVTATPTVFLNGTKLLGLRAENAVVRAVKAVLDSGVVGPGSESGTEPVEQIESALTKEFPQTVERKALAATVRINNPSQRITGSGVIVAVKQPFVYVLSAHHLVSSRGNIEVQTFTEQSYPSPAKSYMPATVIASSKDADLAVIRFSTVDAMPTPVPLAPEGQTSDEPGFPVFSVGCEGEQAPTCLSSVVKAKQRIRRSAGEKATLMWQLEEPTDAGRSGGPMLNQQGQLIGIASGISEGKGYFCHIDEIHRFLELNGLRL